MKPLGSYMITRTFRIIESHELHTVLAYVVPPGLILKPAVSRECAPKGKVHTEIVDRNFFGKEKNLYTPPLS